MAGKLHKKFWPSLGAASSEEKARRKHTMPCLSSWHWHCMRRVGLNGIFPISFIFSGNRLESVHRAGRKPAHVRWGDVQKNNLFLGDSELNDYMDSLARDPERFSRPHNADTGETILHLLAKEGKVEILESLLHDGRMERDVVRGLLFQDRLKWTPVMAATKADSGAKDIIEMFLRFMDQQLESAEDVATLMEAKNKGKDTLFTLIMRDGAAGGLLATTHDFRKARRMLLRLLANHVDVDRELPKWFHALVRQLLEPNSCDLTSRSMKELIDLASEVDVDFSKVLAERDESGNNLLMELAKNMKDDALREILTNSSSSNYVTIR
jgi:hypothetical protein